MEKLQTRLLKAGVGLHKFCKSSPILKAMNINKIETTLEISSLDLIRSIFCNTSRAKSFYSYLLNMHVCGKLTGHTDLVARVKETCAKHDVSFLKYLLDDCYASNIRREMKKCYNVENGLSDSVRQLMLSHDPYDKYVLNLLLTPF